MTTRWHLAKGKVRGVRLPDSVDAIVQARARRLDMTVSTYLRWLIEYAINVADKIVEGKAWVEIEEDPEPPVSTTKRGVIL